MDSVKLKITQYEGIVRAFTTYAEKMEVAYSNIYEITSLLQKHKANLTKSITALRTALSEKSMNMIFMVAHLMEQIEESLDAIYNVIQVGNIPVNMSNTFMDGMDDDFKKITLMKSSMTNLDDLFLDKIKNLEIEIVEKFFNTHPAVHLYAKYLQHRLDENDNVTPALNRLKAFVLAGQEPGLHLQRFGVFPINQNMTFQHLFSRITNIVKYSGGGSGFGIFAELSTLLKKKKIGLFVFANITGTPIIYDFRTITKIKHFCEIPKSQGVGLNTLRKFDFIKQLEQSKPRAEFKKMGYESAEKWIIVRSISDGLFDLMSNSKTEMFVDKELVDKLVRGASPYLSQYHLEMEKKFKPQDLLVVEIDKKTPLKMIATSVTRALHSHIEKKIHNVRSMRDLYALLNGQDVEEITSNILIKSYPFDYSEKLAPTFIANIHYLFSGFVKSIMESIAKSQIKEIIFREKTKSALVVFLRKTLFTIIQNSAAKVFDPRRDIYEKLFIKETIVKLLDERSEKKTR